MKKTILKNKRRPFPFFDFFIPVLIRKNKSFTIVRHFKFTDSTMYHFNDDDQWDVNKLFGFSIGLHHHNSFRFGWRPNSDLTKMEIVGYEYHNKVRTPTIPICEVQLNKWYRYEMKYNAKIGKVFYSVTDFNMIVGTSSNIELKHKINWGYKLFLYFGGNKKSPHDMVIYQEYK